MDTADDAETTKRKVDLEAAEEIPSKKSREEIVNNEDDSSVSASSSKTELPRVGAPPREIDVGITEFISRHEGFSGVIKQRFSDFLVNEIDSEGNIVHLTNTDEPAEEEKKTNSTVLTEEQSTQLTELMNSQDPEKEVVIPVGTDKKLRGQIHQAIRENFTNLNSATVDVDDEKVIKVTWRSVKEKRRQNPWPSDQGDYCRFVLYKENKDTMDAVNVISKMMRLKPGSFAYAGTKDRRAKTCQHMTLYRVPASNLHKINQQLRGMALGNFSYCTNPLKLGDLSGNHFTVVLRNVTGSESQIQSAMESLQSQGFINYFGMQRFGTTSVGTHLVGKALLQRKWSEAINLILQPREVRGADDMAAARAKWAKSKDARAAIKLLPRRPGIEHHLLHGLSKFAKNDLVSALNTIPRNSRLMYVHSYQSFVWNKLLSRRLQKFGFHPIVGDLVLKDTSSKETSPTLITAENLDQFTLPDVVMPLPGFDVTYPANDVGTWYREMLDEDEMGDMKNRVKDYSLPGNYRHIVLKPQHVTWTTTRYDDITQPLVYGDLESMQGNVNPEKCDEGKFLALILSYSLPSSCYATMALREVLKLDTSVAHQSSLNVA